MNHQKKAKRFIREEIETLGPSMSMTASEYLGVVLALERLLRETAVETWREARAELVESLDAHDDESIVEHVHYLEALFKQKVQRIRRGER